MTGIINALGERMSNVRRPWEIQAAGGLISGVQTVNKFGWNPDIDAGTEDIWSVGGTWVPPTVARVHSITGDANDVLTSGSGAWTVEVQGLNGSFVETTETVDMAGAGGVNTVNSYIIVFRLVVLTAGSGGTNSGAILATAATDATVTCGIVAARGQSQMAIYQVPAGFSAYLSCFSGSMNGSATANVSVEIYAKPLGGVYNLKGTLNISGSGGAFAARIFPTPLVFAEKTIIKLTGTSDAPNSNVAGNFDLVCIAN